MSDKNSSLSYADAGVDIDAGNALVDGLVTPYIAQITTIPEPSTSLLFALGMAWVAIVDRRRP